MKNQNPLMIKDLFNKTSSRYDVLNDLLSLGLHRHWKKQTIWRVKPAPGEKWIDLCCGTGDLTFRLARFTDPGGEVVGIDFAEKALAIARKRHKKIPSLKIAWMNIDATSTGLESHSFDGALMAYGLRNLKDPVHGLIEIHRLLKTEGRAAILDFNHPREGSIGDKFQKFYLKNIVVRLAKRLDLQDEYEYIQESINRFPTGNELEQLALKIGFSKASHQAIAGNQMGILFLES